MRSSFPGHASDSLLHHSNAKLSSLFFSHYFLFSSSVFMNFPVFFFSFPFLSLFPCHFSCWFYFHQFAWKKGARAWWVIHLINKLSSCVAALSIHISLPFANFSPRVLFCITIFCVFFFFFFCSANFLAFSRSILPIPLTFCWICTSSFLLSFFSFFFIFIFHFPLPCPAAPRIFRWNKSVDGRQLFWPAPGGRRRGKYRDAGHRQQPARQRVGIATKHEGKH